MKEKVIGDYLLIGGVQHIENFTMSIQRLINNGWQPFGPPFIGYKPSLKTKDGLFYQALVRYKEDENVD